MATSMFINPDEKVPVHDDQGNTIWIKAGMDLETEARYKDVLIKVTPDMGEGGRKRKKQRQKVLRKGQTREQILAARRGEVEESDEDLGGMTELMIGSAQRELLVLNILGWEGPDFDQTPCTPGIIRTLNPRKALVRKVLQRIQELNESEDLPEGEEEDEYTEHGELILEGNVVRDSADAGNGNYAGSVITPSR